MKFVFLLLLLVAITYIEGTDRVKVTDIDRHYFHTVDANYTDMPNYKVMFLPGTKYY